MASPNRYQHAPYVHHGRRRPRWYPQRNRNYAPAQRGARGRGSHHMHRRHSSYYSRRPRAVINNNDSSSNNRNQCKYHALCRNVLKRYCWYIPKEFVDASRNYCTCKDCLKGSHAEFAVFGLKKDKGKLIMNNVCDLDDWQAVYSGTSLENCRETFMSGLCLLKPDNLNIDEDELKLPVQESPISPALEAVYAKEFKVDGVIPGYFAKLVFKGRIPDRPQSIEWYRKHPAAITLTALLVKVYPNPEGVGNHRKENERKENMENEAMNDGKAEDDAFEPGQEICVENDDERDVFDKYENVYAEGETAIKWLYYDMVATEWKQFETAAAELLEIAFIQKRKGIFLHDHEVPPCEVAFDWDSKPPKFKGIGMDLQYQKRNVYVMRTGPSPLAHSFDPNVNYV